MNVAGWKEQDTAQMMPQQTCAVIKAKGGSDTGALTDVAHAAYMNSASYHHRPLNCTLIRSWMVPLMFRLEDVAFIYILTRQTTGQFSTSLPQM